MSETKRILALSAAFLLAAVLAGAGPAPQLRVRTIAGSDTGLGHRDAQGVNARFSNPSHLAIGCDGAIVLVDAGSHTIRRITREGDVSTIAGRPYVRGSVDGSDALFAAPEGVAVAPDCSIWVADTGNHSVRRIHAGVVTTIAGSAGVAGSNDGSGTAARFNMPVDVALDPASGDAFVADLGNASIRRVTPAGVVTTLAPPAPALNQPNGVAFDATGRLVVAELYGNSIRFRRSDGVWSRVTFRPTAYPADAAAGADGRLFVADQLSNVIWEVPAQGSPQIVAGIHSKIGEENGPALSATFSQPRGIGVLADGTLAIAESRNGLLRSLRPDGIVRTLAGQNADQRSVDGRGDDARFRGPRHAAQAEDGAIFVTDGTTIRRIAQDGTVTTLAGLDGAAETVDGSGGAARFRSPYGIVIAPGGTIFVSDSLDHVIRRVTSAGDVTTIAGKTGVSGSVDGVGSEARFYDPLGIAIDGNGDLYVADRGSHAVRKIAMADLRVTTHAGLLGVIGSGDGPAQQARFFNPWDVDVDARGIVFVLDENTHVIQKIENGQVTTVARTHETLRSSSLVVEPDGTLLVSESQSSTIRRATLGGGEPFIGERLEPGNRDGGTTRARLTRANGIEARAGGGIIISDTDNGVVKVAELVFGPWIDSFTASPASILAGGSATLGWCTEGGGLATISPGIGSVPECGSVTVSPGETTTYTLEVGSSGGMERRDVTVTVVTPVRRRTVRR